LPNRALVPVASVDPTSPAVPAIVETAIGGFVSYVEPDVYEGPELELEEPQPGRDIRAEIINAYVFLTGSSSLFPPPGTGTFLGHPVQPHNNIHFNHHPAKK
jgi:hypothetical protein